jgi:hypothetical protein
MDAVHRHRQGMLRLPLRAAIFVALVCGAILGISAWREWTAREAVLKTAEVETANLARSLTQHAEDSFDLLDASILGVATRLEADGLNPKTIATLHKIMVTRKAHLDRLHFLVICDENGNWISSSGATGGNLDDRDYFQYHKHSASNDVFVGRPVKGKTDGKWVTTVSRRFNHPDGSFAGVVVATITASYFGDFYSQFDAAEHRWHHDGAHARPQQCRARHFERSVLPRDAFQRTFRSLLFSIVDRRHAAARLLPAQQPLSLYGAGDEISR